MLTCDITGIAQEMDLAHNITLTYLVLRLPDGTLLRAGIDDNAAAAVVQIHARSYGPPKAQTFPDLAPTEEPVPQEPASPYSFDNDTSPSAATVPDTEESETVSPPSVPVRKSGFRFSKGNTVARTVPRNDYGYPMLADDGVDTDSFTGGRDRDEDGVGSI